MRPIPTLPPMLWELVPITPLPEVTDSNTDSAWARFDAAQADAGDAREVPLGSPTSFQGENPESPRMERSVALPLTRRTPQEL